MWTWPVPHEFSWAIVRSVLLILLGTAAYKQLIGPQIPKPQANNSVPFPFSTTGCSEIEIASPACLINLRTANLSHCKSWVLNFLWHFVVSFPQLYYRRLRFVKYESSVLFKQKMYLLCLEEGGGEIILRYRKQETQLIYWARFFIAHTRN